LNTTHHHGSLWDAVGTWAIAGSGYFVSLGHALQGLFTAIFAVSSAVSAYVAFRRLRLDEREKRNQAPVIPVAFRTEELDRR
jgi:hypothetical protein